MSLYGLDILIDQEGREYLNEINGVCSGMGGFEQIYGDNRVQERVFDMLQEKYGELTVNDGTFRRNKFKKEHPLRFVYISLMLRLPILLKLRSYVNIMFGHSVLLSRKSEIDWLNDNTGNEISIELPFTSYDGQESTVINLLNEELPHALVNSYIAEEIAGNKFLQYMLLKDSTIAGNVIRSSLVGLGATDERELENLLSEYKDFVVKPILGSCGKGVRFLNREEVEKKYKYSRGPLNYVSYPEFISTLRGLHGDREAQNVKYLEDMIDDGDFTFELGLSIIQPFIESRKIIDNEEKYSVVRAIVCNGEFVDAYLRVDLDPRVNLSRDAYPISFKIEDDFAALCENIVRTFEDKTQDYEPDSFKKMLYQRYIDDRGRTSEANRDFDVMSPIMRTIANMVK